MEVNDNKDVILGAFAKKLKELRIAHGLSTRDLEKDTGISNATISRYEMRIRNPRLSSVYKIAKYFNVSIEYLCGEDIELDKKQLLEVFDELSDESKKEVLRYITYLYERKKK